MANATMENRPRTIRANYGNNQPQYYALIERIPLLPASEVLRLLPLAQAGDASAIHAIVEGNYRLAAAMLERYFRAYLEYPHNALSPDDLFTEAVAGLQRSIQTYDPRRSRFSTYAAFWIFQSIQRAIDGGGHMIYFPVWVWDELRRAGRDFPHDGFKSVIDAANLPRAAVSTDAPCDDEEDGGSESNGRTLIDSIPDKTSEADYEFEIRDDVARALKCLTPREREVIARCYGMNGFEPHTFRATADLMGLFHERVRQIRDEALKKLAVASPNLQFYCEK